MTAPNETPVGERVTIGGEVTVPDQPGSYETEVTVQLEIDGTEIDRQTVTVRDGETTQVSFSHTFDSAGDHRVRLIAETSFAGYAYSDDATTTITVAAPTEVSTPTVTGVPTSTEVVPGGEFTGAALPVPESLRDDVDAYRSQAGDVGAYAFLLVTESDAYIVFTPRQPKPGRARVTGRLLTSDAVTINGVQFGVIAATDVTDTTDVESVSVSELRDQPGEYAREVVRVKDHHQQAAVLFDPDAGANVTLPQTVGVIGGSPTEEVFANLTDKTVKATGEPERVQKQLTNANGIPTVGFSEGYWVDAEQTVQALVFPPDGPGQAYVEAISNVSTPSDRPVLYRLQASFDAQQAGIGEVAEAPEEYKNRLLTLEADAAFAHLSSQETLHEATSCGDDMVPVKEACVPLVNDVLVSAGGASGGNAEASLAVVAASNRHFDTPVTTGVGHYTIIGEVRTIRLTGEGEPAPIFVAYDIERQGEPTVDLAGATDKRERLRDQLSTSLEAHAQVAATAAVSAGVQTTTETSNGNSSGGDGSQAQQTDSEGSGGTAPTPNADGPGLGVTVAVVAIVLGTGLRRWFIA